MQRFFFPKKERRKKQPPPLVSLNSRMQDPLILFFVKGNFYTRMNRFETFPRSEISFRKRAKNLVLTWLGCQQLDQMGSRVVERKVLTKIMCSLQRPFCLKRQEIRAFFEIKNETKSALSSIFCFFD